jgi:hypothetical protein
MKLTILSAKDFSINLKCTIHSTGKLGFTDGTTKHLELTENSGIKFAIDENDNNTLYLINCKQWTPDAFKVNKAGNYFYINAKALFDRLGYDYRKKSIIFDMTFTPENNEEGDIYKLTKREKPRPEKE